MKFLALLGRQPALGLAELESLLGAQHIRPLVGAALLDNDDIPFSRLGGCIKLAKVLTTLPTTDWKAIEKHLVSTAPRHAEYINGKLTVGISAIGMGVPVKQINATALSLKKALRASGVSVRIVPNKSNEISTPQVIHNKLTGPNGWELIAYRNDKETIIAQTTHVQDIEAYTARDQARPARDARVGMLPPKLAQIIINLATGPLRTQNTEPKTILDPFCGTGVVLQEALLMGYDAYGTDIEPRMIEYTQQNIEWLVNEWKEKSGQWKNHNAAHSNDNKWHAEVGDATSHIWPISELITKNSRLTVACEGYLGLPFAHMPSPDHLQESIQASNTIAKGFLKNIYSQVESGFRMCIGFPAWHLPKSVKHLPCLDQLESIGWRRVQFVHAKQNELVYRRDDQVVGRELVVLVKK